MNLAENYDAECRGPVKNLDFLQVLAGAEQKTRLKCVMRMYRT